MIPSSCEIFAGPKPWIGQNREQELQTKEVKTPHIVVGILIKDLEQYQLVLPKGNANYLKEMPVVPNTSSEPNALPWCF